MSLKNQGGIVMIGVEDLTEGLKIELIESYGLYIQNANEEDLYKDGWRPVCISEYLNCEFAEEMLRKGIDLYETCCVQ